MPLEKETCYIHAHTWAIILLLSAINIAVPAPILQKAVDMKYHEMNWKVKQQ